MNGTTYIIKGDNAKVHAWFTEHDRLYECHCDSCCAARNAERQARIIRDIKNEKIYNATGIVGCVAIPLTIIAAGALLVAGLYGWGAGAVFALAGEIVAASVICAKTNPWR